MAAAAGTGTQVRGRRLALGCGVTAVAAATLVAILVVVSNVVAKPLGTVAAFAIGASLVASRAELSEALLEAYGIEPGPSAARLHELWIAGLGVLVATTAPTLVIVL